MSKYKYEFGVSTNKLGSECSEIVDLVDDWGYDEKELDAMKDRALELLINELVDEFVANNADSWAKSLDGSREV